MFSSSCTSVPLCPSDRSCLGRGLQAAQEQLLHPGAPQIPIPWRYHRFPGTDRKAPSTLVTMEYSGHTVVELRSGGDGECSICVRFHGHAEGFPVESILPMKFCVRVILPGSNILSFSFSQKENWISRDGPLHSHSGVSPAGSI